MTEQTPGPVTPADPGSSAPAPVPAQPEIPDSTPQFPTAAAQPGDDEYLVGTWSGLPNYGCPHCDFVTTAGSETVRLHVNRAHPETLLG
jgi:hypothetical protein